VRAAILAIVAGCASGPRVGSPCAGPPAFLPFDDAKPRTRPSPPDGILDALVAFYQGNLRAHEPKQAGCPFAPTCSVYAREALIVDRLIVREHPFAAASYPATCVDHTTRLVDAVP
jgi:membrane protein insertion efficiency factor YidD